MYPKSSGRTDSLRTAGIAADPVAACQKCASRAQLSAQLLATCEDTAKCGYLPIAGVYMDPLENLTAADPNCLRQIRNVDWLKLSTHLQASSGFGHRCGFRLASWFWVLMRCVALARPSASLQICRCCVD